MAGAPTILQKRLPKELKQLQESSEGFRVALVDDCITRWLVTLPPPPEDSPYATGIFRVEVTFPPEYPHAPPQIRFQTPVYSPSVDSEGKLCERMFDGWQPSQTALHALQLVRSIFVDYTIGVVNVEASKLALENGAAFQEKVRAHTKRFASR